MASTLNPDLASRTKTALVLVVCFVSLAISANYSELIRFLFATLVFILVATASYEFVMVASSKLRVKIYLRFLAFVMPALTVLLAAYFCPSFNVKILAILAFGIGVLFLSLLITSECMNNSQTNTIESIVRVIGIDQIGFLLLGFGGASAVGIAFLSPILALKLVAIVAAADISAYFAGRFYGVSRIAPIVSPKKTYAGTLAGITFGASLGAFLLSLSSCLSWPSAFLFSTLLVLASQSGDYAKSIVKRLYDVKDFGKIFPGHGGALDRLDGILGAAPIMLILMLLCIQ